jgi:hypothetical protein
VRQSPDGYPLQLRICYSRVVSRLYSITWEYARFIIRAVQLYIRPELRSRTGAFVANVHCDWLRYTCLHVSLLDPLPTSTSRTSHKHSYALVHSHCVRCAILVMNSDHSPAIIGRWKDYSTGGRTHLLVLLALFNGCS